MQTSLAEQFAAVVRDVGRSANAYMCEGNPNAAMVWDDSTEITVRLMLRADEMWLLAGSGTLVRLIAPSDGEFDREAITQLIAVILRGDAVEYFGVRPPHKGSDVFVTGFEIESGGVAGGLDGALAAFRTRLAGPLAQAALDVTG